MAISGPIALYNNLPIQSQYYEPSQYVISAISLGLTTTVTATEDLNFVIGQEVRLLIPPSFGSRQLNNQTGFVLSIPATNQVVISLDSLRNVDPFINSSDATKAQIIPIGDINMGSTNSQGRVNTGTFIPGSFINISPQ